MKKSNEKARTKLTSSPRFFVHMVDVSPGLAASASAAARFLSASLREHSSNRKRVPALRHGTRPAVASAFNHRIVTPTVLAAWAIFSNALIRNPV
jgi:hypothetical protein